MITAMHLRFATFFLLALAPLAAEDRLARIFQDGMVLQREMPVPVWGWAAPGAAVTVAFAGQTKAATAGADGAWKTMLDPLAASREGRVLEVRIGDTAIARKNVLVGEVWVAAGQSNMVAGGPDQDSGVYPHHVSPGTRGGKPEIRHIRFGSGASLEPLADAEDRSGKGWEVFQEDPPPTGMGPAYYFSRVVRDAVDVPFGLVLVAVPGTNQAAWMARETLAGFPAEDKKLPDFYQERLAECTEALAKSGTMKTWDDVLAAEAAWRKAPKGHPPSNGLPVVNFPTALYNTRIHPLAPFAFRGVIWHQGEAGPRGPYGERLVAMARQWRALFGQDFCFVWGTLGRSTDSPPPLAPLRAGFYRSGTNGGIRQALKAFGDDRRVAMVELYDLGNENTHYEMKAEAGRRYALAALTVAYGQDHLYSGPRMLETKLEGGKAVIRFAMAGTGLQYQPSIAGISGFYLRGKDGPARWGEVKIVAPDTIEVTHPDIAAPATVGYGEHPNPHETLFNSAGLPASPFTVNAATGKEEPSPISLLAITAKSGGTDMQLCHVRRSGYVFQLKATGKDKPAPATLRAWIPAEWKGFEVESGGKPVAVQEEVKDGNRFALFTAPVDKAWIIVAEAGKAEAFRKINRF
jgi:sialate O-acetylesterase